MTVQLLTQIDSSALDTKRYKGSRGGVRLIFHWGAFDIEKIVEEKMVNTSFGGTADHGSGHLALALPTQGQLVLGLPGPCVGQT